MILEVSNLSHGFGDRAIFDNVSFRLLKGEHIGLVGANGEGKSTFMNIVTGSLQPDEGKVTWAKNIKVGYLDQHTVLEKGLTIGDVLRSAFERLFAMEQRINEICDEMGNVTDDDDKGISGAQIDLLIDRRDRVVSICEIKYSINEFIIDKSYDMKLRNKIGSFVKATNCKKSVQMVMVTTYGIKKNMYSGSINAEVVLDDLFEK